MKYSRTYWVLFVVIADVWLISLFVVKHDESFNITAKLNEAEQDSVLVTELKYSIIKIGTEVEKNQLIGYRKDEHELKSMQALNDALSNYRDLDELNANIKDIYINNLEIKRLYLDLLNNLKQTASSKLTSSKIITKKISTNKAKLQKAAELKLKKLQEQYALRQTTIDDLKKASDEIQKIKLMPEYKIARLEKKLDNRNETNHSVNNRQPNKLLQSKIFMLMGSVQNWLADNEIKSPVSGKVETINEDSKTAIIVQTSKTRILSFRLAGIKDSSILVNLLCNSGTRKIEQEAVKSDEESIYNIITDENTLKSCLIKNSKTAKIQVKLASRSQFDRLIGKGKR